MQKTPELNGMSSGLFVKTVWKVEIPADYAAITIYLFRKYVSTSFSQIIGMRILSGFSFSLCTLGWLTTAVRPWPKAVMAACGGLLWKTSRIHSVKHLLPISRPIPSWVSRKEQGWQSTSKWSVLSYKAVPKQLDKVGSWQADMSLRT